MGRQVETNGIEHDAIMVTLEGRVSLDVDSCVLHATRHTVNGEAMPDMNIVWKRAR